MEARWRSVPPGLRKILREFPRPALHAAELALEHPITGQSLELKAEMPPDLAELWEAAGGDRAAID